MKKILRTKSFYRKKPLFKEPWRTIPWGKEDLQEIKAPKKMKMNHLRVLVCGPVGSGKSSFISSVSSIFKERVCSPALASPCINGHSFTKKYKNIRIPTDDKENSFCLIFNDIMGLEEGTNRGVSVEDVILILDGRMKDDYKLNPVSPLSTDDPHYNAVPSVEDKVHVLVWVCSATSTQINHSVLQKMKAIRDAASRRAIRQMTTVLTALAGIPQLAVVTNVDEACKETHKDLKNVYRSIQLKGKMTLFSATLGIPLSCTFPVKNYNEEIDLKNDVDCLILSVVKTIIDCGSDVSNSILSEVHLV